MMLQLLSFALFSTVMLVSIMAIVATVQAEMVYILRALGISPELPPLRPTGERRVRIISQATPVAPKALRAAA
ncbi:hypothetical protein [Rhizorhabdus argentea]|uniref:hypothetical protein n=1 Tax=Rhizorhabdus argentea TaxID=1387174 RepID=UPI0030ED83FC